MKYKQVKRKEFNDFVATLDARTNTRISFGSAYHEYSTDDGVQAYFIESNGSYVFMIKDDG